MSRLTRVLRPAALAAAVSACPSLLAQTAAPTFAPLVPFTSITQLDPDLQTVVHYYDIFRGTPIIDLTPQDARQQISIQDTAKLIARYTGDQLAPTPVGKIYDQVSATGIDGHQIPVRIYVPKSAPPASGYYPVVLYFHGGGFVVATIDTYDESARNLADDANAIVVSVEYRKGPEQPFPDALRDADSSYTWVVDNIRTYGGNPNKIAVAGESAGGNLATEVALHVRGASLPKPVYELLIYPVTSTNLDQKSDLLYTSPILPLNTPALPYFFKNYNPDMVTNQDIQPINADLKGLPPTTIIAAQFDPLVSDGQVYATRLAAAGVVVDYQLYTGMTHEFFGLGSEVAKARTAEAYAGTVLATAFNK